ncbi:MAG: hypothetical protein JWP57_3987 [Spirosoma sp.]|nr:hypothetical protein [Spirosoma sp.]
MRTKRQRRCIAFFAPGTTTKMIDASIPTLAAGRMGIRTLPIQLNSESGRRTRGSFVTSFRAAGWRACLRPVSCRLPPKGRHSPRDRRQHPHRTARRRRAVRPGCTMWHHGYHGPAMDQDLLQRLGGILANELKLTWDLSFHWYSCSPSYKSGLSQYSARRAITNLSWPGQIVRSTATLRLDVRMARRRLA